MKFSDITGRKEFKRMLAGGVDQGRVSHAQLLVGAGGYGTLPLALAYAQYVNCTDRRGGDSCGVCPSCRKMEALAHPDLHFVFPVNSAKSGSQKPLSDAFLPRWRELFAATGGYFDEQMWYAAIDIENQQGLITRAEADEIIRKLSFKSFEGRYKVMIIWLPEKMRPEAANALLKILEEPWERTLFLMVSEAPGKLLPTILSRTQQVNVPGIEDEALAEYLAAKYAMDPQRAAATARLAEGDMIRARRLAEGEEGGREEYLEMFMQLMRLSYNDRHMELLEWGDAAAALGREQQKSLLHYAARMLRENYMLNMGMEGIVRLQGGEMEFSRKFSPFIGNHNVEAIAAEIDRAVAQIAQNGNPRIIFPHFALTVSKLIVRL